MGSRSEDEEPFTMTKSPYRTVVVTGSNRGIGLELVRRFAADAERGSLAAGGPTTRRS